MNRRWQTWVSATMLAAFAAWGLSVLLPVRTAEAWPPWNGTGLQSIWSAAGGTPILNPSWSEDGGAGTANYYVDPANSSTHAVDGGNSCISAATPCLTWHHLHDQVWGCLGSTALGCPRFRQNTTITFQSSQSGNTDPVYFQPIVENGALLILQGTPTVAATVSLSGVVAKNRTTPQLLNATLGGSAAVNQVLINTTHPSHATVYKLVSGTTYVVTQPLVNGALPHNVTQAEVDTWANTDSVSLNTLTNIDLVAFLPLLSDGATGGGTNGRAYLNQFFVYDPPAAGDTTKINDNVRGFDTVFQRRVQIDNYGNDWQFVPGCLNCTFLNGVGRPGASAQSFVLTGGSIQLVSAANAVGTGTIALDADLILNTGQATFGTGVVGVGFVALDTGGVLQASTGGLINVGNFNGYGGPIVWNTGAATAISALTQSKVVYPSGASGAANTFKMSGALGANGQTLGCITKPSAASYATCNTTINVANLDANNGATAGCLTVPSGASYCNFGP